MLYSDCQHAPVRLTEHLRGTRECELNKNTKAKSLNMMCTTGVHHLAILNPLALCHTSHINGLGHRPNFAIMGITECC